MLPSDFEVRAFLVVFAVAALALTGALLASILRRGLRRANLPGCAFGRAYAAGVCQALSFAGILLALNWLHFRPIPSIAAAILAGCLSGLAWMLLILRLPANQALRLWLRTIPLVFIAMLVSFFLMALVFVWVSYLLFPPVY